MHREECLVLLGKHKQNNKNSNIFLGKGPFRQMFLAKSIMYRPDRMDLILDATREDALYWTTKK